MLNKCLKNYIFLLVRGAIIVVFSSLIGMLLMLAVYGIPVDRIRFNVMDSASVFEKEGVGPKLWYFYSTALDNYTDALMLLEAANDSDEQLVDRALLNYYEETYTEGELDYPCNSLIKIANNIADNNDIESDNIVYGRYWHGYLIWLKPILLVFNYVGIRVINAILQMAVTVALLYQLFKREKKYLFIGMCMAIMILLPTTTALSMQYSSCYYIFMLGSLVVMRLSDKYVDGDLYLLVFIILGILTSFFDFLTYPVTTFAIPYVFYIVLVNEKTIKNSLLNFIEHLTAWGIGYAGMWGMKWIIASLFTDQNIILNAMSSLKERTTAISTPVYVVIVRNVGAFVINPFTIIAIIVFLVCYYNIRKKHEIEIISIFIIIGLVPFGWFLFAGNHSYNHFWFTFRNLVISVISMFGMLEQRT